MIIIIDNLNFGFHFETIESLIVKYDQILKIPKNDNYEVYLENIKSQEYIKYINSKYPKIKINSHKKEYNYKIFSTFYPKFQNKFNDQLNNNKNFFISHDTNPILDKYNNIFYLTPLCNKTNFIYANILPDIIKKQMDYPIYVIQGNFSDDRRNYKLLENILKYTYPYEFKFKFLGKGNFPKIMEKYMSKIIVKNNLKFLDYHKEFSDCYCILPLITKKSHPQYYKDKLTSTISYAMAYDLKCLIDQDLQNIYKLNNVEIFNDETDFKKVFNKTLNHFYQSKLKK